MSLYNRHLNRLLPLCNAKIFYIEENPLNIVPAKNATYNNNSKSNRKSDYQSC